MASRFPRMVCILGKFRIRKSEWLPVDYCLRKNIRRDLKKRRHIFFIDRSIGNNSEIQIQIPDTH